MEYVYTAWMKRQTDSEIFSVLKTAKCLLQKNTNRSSTAFVLLLSLPKEGDRSSSALQV